MAIRPNKGDQVVMLCWNVIDDQPTPPRPWLGTVFFIRKVGKRVMYDVGRKHDGAIVTLISSYLRRPTKEELKNEQTGSTKQINTGL